MEYSMVILLQNFGENWQRRDFVRVISVGLSSERPSEHNGHWKGYPSPATVCRHGPLGGESVVWWGWRDGEMTIYCAQFISQAQPRNVTVRVDIWILYYAQEIKNKTCNEKSTKTTASCPTYRKISGKNNASIMLRLLFPCLGDSTMPWASARNHASSRPPSLLFCRYKV